MSCENLQRTITGSDCGLWMGGIDLTGCCSGISRLSACHVLVAARRASDRPRDVFQQSAEICQGRSPCFCIVRSNAGYMKYGGELIVPTSKPGGVDDPARDVAAPAAKLSGGRPSCAGGAEAGNMKRHVHDVRDDQVQVTLVGNEMDAIAGLQGAGGRNQFG